MFVCEFVCSSASLYVRLRVCKFVCEFVCSSASLYARVNECER